MSIPLPDAVQQAVRRYGERFGWLAARAAETDEVARSCHPCEGRSDRLAAECARAGLPASVPEAFSAEPLAPGDGRWVARAADRERLLACLTAWREQHPAMLAVVGPQGSGVTSLLRQIEAALEPGEQITYHALDGRPTSARDALVQCARLFNLGEVPLSVESLAAAINQLEPRLIVLDNGHFLACRIMGASESIRTLGALMVATQERHQWILGCRVEAWRRLSYVHRVERFFSDVIELAPFTANELAAWACARFKAAGFALAAATDQPPAGDDAAGACLPSDFAARLHARSGGLPAPATNRLLRSLQHAEAGWQIEECVSFDYGALQTMDRLEAFTLAEIAVHGALTAAEHRSLLRLSDQDSQMLLQRLCALGLLEHTRQQGRDIRYRLVPAHAGVIVEKLHNANYLY